VTADIIILAAAKAERKLRERQARSIAHSVAYLIAVLGPVLTPDDVQALRELVTEEAARDRALFGDDIVITEARG